MHAVLGMLQLPQVTPEEKCIKYLQRLNSMKSQIDKSVAKTPETINTPKSGANVNLAEILFQTLFCSEKSDNTKLKNAANEASDESSDDDELLDRLVCRAKVFPDESPAESDCDEDMERFVDDCLLYQDWNGVENHFRDYLRENVGRISFVRALQSVQRIIQPKMRRKLKRVVMTHFKADELKKKMKLRKSSENSVKTSVTTNDHSAEVMKSKESSPRKTEEQIEGKNIKSESPKNSSVTGDTNFKDKRRSGRLLSHPDGYFQTKAPAKVYILTEGPTKKQSTSPSLNVKVSKRKKAVDNVRHTANDSPKISNVKEGNSELKKKINSSNTIKAAVTTNRNANAIKSSPKKTEEQIEGENVRPESLPKNTGGKRRSGRSVPNPVVYLNSIDIKVPMKVNNLTEESTERRKYLSPKGKVSKKKKGADNDKLKKKNNITDEFEGSPIRTEEETEVTSESPFENDTVTDKTRVEGRRSERLLSHPAGYFQTKAPLKVYILKEDPTKRRKSLPPNIKINNKQRKVNSGIKPESNTKTRLPQSEAKGRKRKLYFEPVDRGDTKMDSNKKSRHSLSDLHSGECEVSVGKSTRLSHPADVFKAKKETIVQPRGRTTVSKGNTRNVNNV